ncbi:MAG TPA: hypothetical protein VMW38_06795 [Terriglobia bacterium]|nr:hypothetical protein [Terriglobia bacterium]
MKRLQRFSIWTAKCCVVADFPDCPTRFNPTDHIVPLRALIFETNLRTAINADLLKPSQGTLGEI